MLAYCAARLPQLQGHGNERRCACPLHKGTRDSFALNVQTGLWTCHACGRSGDLIQFERESTGADFKTARAEVLHLVGRPDSGNGSGSRRSSIVAEYDYQDESGRVVYQTVRYDPKSFKQRRPKVGGGWIWNLNGVRPILYRLPELLKRPRDTVFICEGEKDVHSLEALGFLATCNPMGARKWRDSFAETLRGRRIAIIADNDPARDERGNPHFKGQKHAGEVAESLLRHNCEVRIIEPPRGKDVSEWLAAGGSADEISRLVDELSPLDAGALESWRKRWSLPDERESTGVDRASPEGWHSPLPLHSDLPQVEPFYQELLPLALRPLVLDIAERMQVPVDYPAVALVLCVAGVVNRRAMIQPKTNDIGWIVVPNLWGGIVAPPGFMKSPVIQAATSPLNQIQSRWRREHADALLHYEQENEEFQLRHAAWKEQYKSSSKGGKPAPERPTDKPVMPKSRRLIVNDSTFEALHETMSENPAGILMIRDELTGWWSTLDRAGREGERAFSLQAWNGDTGHTIDRIGRGTIHVEACCMSMIGGIQPGRLRSYLVDALKDGPGNDGLIQRFQLLVWPDTAPEWVYLDRIPNEAAEESAAIIFRSLLELDEENPARFRFDPAAQELFIEWWAGLEAKVRSDELHPALVSHLSKYRSLMPSLALLFELVDRASIDGFVGSLLAGRDNFVSLEHTRQAAAFCDYLESHARRVYSCVETPQLRAARELAEKIKSRKVGANGAFSCREIYLKGWSGLDSPEAVKQAAEVLSDAHWLRALPSEPRPLGGRPPDRYEINPAVWG